MYFIQKEAVYFHGVFWIGEDYEEGMAKLYELAESDVDDHHEWVLYEFIENPEVQSSGIRHHLHVLPKHFECKRISKDSSSITT